MSRAIAKLLSKPEELVSSALKKAEDINGNPSADVRLLADNYQLTRFKIAQLGLDPNDTTGEELYEALKTKFTADSLQLDKALGLSGAAPIAEKIDKAVQLVVTNGHLPQRWLLKHPTAKKLLRQLPPKKLSKQLGYRSLDSLLKRENIDEIWLAARQLESRTWQSKMTKAVSHLDSAAFEARRLQVLALPDKFWQGAKASRHFISDFFIGAAAVWPSGLESDSHVLAIALGLLRELEKLSGSDLSGSLGDLNPALRWWLDNSCLLSSHKDGPVSLNIHDLAVDHLRGRSYQARSSQHAAQALLDKLARSYEYAPEKVAAALKGIGYNLTDDTNSARELAGAHLALEYAEAE
ncbi:MAG TPA: hypothetical protein VEH48_01600 [Candidatus Nitrosopolaris sp.]|nr:hypothetical protein [Candidatus Nitrosopolaris sp.]